MVPTQIPETAGGAPIDLDVLARLMGDARPDNLNRMLAVFWQAEAETPLTLRRFADARDGKALADAAHGAKGAAAVIGALEIADLCKALELNAGSGDWDAVGRLMTQVEQAYAAARAFIAARQPLRP